MGALVDLRSDGFSLPEYHFEEALEYVQVFARHAPAYFRDGARAAKAKTLDAALKAAGFALDKDGEGHAVAIRYVADKPPPEAGDLWPLGLFEKLAPAVDAGTVVVHLEGDERETVYEFRRRRVRARTRKRR
jgi:hypothetical protein